LLSLSKLVFLLANTESSIFLIILKYKILYGRASPLRKDLLKTGQKRGEEESPLVSRMHCSSFPIPDE